MLKINCVFADIGVNQVLPENLVDHFLHRYPFSGDTVLFFKGFDRRFYKELASQSELQHFVDQDIEAVFDDKNQNSNRNLMQGLMTAKGIQWGTYEELVALTNDVTNLSSFYNGHLFVVNNNLFRNFYPSYRQNIQELVDSANKVGDSDKKILYSDFRQNAETTLVQYVLKHKDGALGMEIPDLDFYDAPIRASFDDESAGTVKNISLYSLNDIVAECYLGKIKNTKYVISPGKRQTIDDNYLSLLNSFFNKQSLHFTMANSGRSFEKSALPVSDHLKYLKEYWGKDAAYRSGKFYDDPYASMVTREISQSVIIDDVLTQVKSARSEGTPYYDLVVTAPTGSGKSLFFQVPGIVLHKEYQEITIVVTPLQALMKDQADGLTKRGVEFATYINSQISLEERNRRLQEIKNGKYSILYLAPELLLNSKIENLIGDRRIGLFVVDEAHLVTSWGRDFRVDYWFLGDFISRLRNGSYYSKAKRRDFPVLVLTATAVLGGHNDEIGTLIDDLHLRVDENNHMYIGKVRRDQIEFQIHQMKKSVNNSKDEKIAKVLNRINQFVHEGIKTIVYCPYRSQCDTLMTGLHDFDETVNNKVACYYGSMSPDEKNKSYANFKSGKVTVMIATTAFGMGIDIDDIQAVYHLAPTGGLPEYVQEIGRAARKLDHGYAITDFFSNDMHYARTLWGLGGIRQYQLREIAKQLSNLSQSNKTRNLLISPESFSHLFDTNDIDQKVKSGLMLLTTDLEDRYHFKVITIRPKSLYTRQFIQASGQTLAEIKHDLKEFIKPVNQPQTKRDPGNFLNGDVITTTMGEIMELDMGKLWEKRFNSLSFPDFKWKFFNENSLFSYPDRVIPKMLLTIDYGETDYDELSQKFNLQLEKLSEVILQIKRECGSHLFSLNDFKRAYQENFPKSANSPDNAAQLILELLTQEKVDNTNKRRIPWQFISFRKNPKTGERAYSFMRNGQTRTLGQLKRQMQSMKPDVTQKNSYSRYLPIPKYREQQSDIHMAVASLLQIWGLATYEIVGGYNSQVFVRINDPQKLRWIVSNKQISNEPLKEIDERHRAAGKFMTQFLSGKRSSKQNWDIIENYFLGRDDVVNGLLAGPSGS